MIWMSNKKSNTLIMVYGFKNLLNRAYDTVLTLSINNKKDRTFIFGLLSKVLLNPNDFISLWHYIISVIPTKYIMFEVMKEHSKIYQTYLKPISIAKTKTFNGFDSETLKIKIR